MNKTLVRSLFFFALACSYASAEERILRWTEVRDINGKNVTLTGKQVFDAGSGSQQTLYYDQAGNPLPDSFVQANQKRWSDSGGVSADAESAPARAEREKVVPASVRFHLATSSVTVALDAPDLAPILAEDQRNEQSDAKGPKRIGFFRKLPRSVTPRKWITLPDGSKVWSLRLTSPGAEAIRVHVKDVKLPDGATIVEYNSDHPEEAYGPYGADYVPDTNEFWTESSFGQGVTVECTVPKGRSVAGVSFEIDKIVHVYQKFNDWGRPKEGNCHNDVTCFPEWASAASGVCGLGNIGDDGFLFCTGCLIADGDPSTTINYFMTANHCVSNQGEANTLEFYWFYQTSTCNGAPPNILTVPRTSGGADYLAGVTVDAGSDFAFLRMRNSPPGGTTFEGWTTTGPNSTETLSGIHHPDGAYKRISFGHFHGYDGNLLDVQWFSGVTEPGSSGSPLFNESQQFLGQLYGGHSFCAFPQGIDEYGRFDVTFPMIASFLSPSPPPPLLFYEDPRDFDGDGRTDLAVYNAPSANWYFLESAAGFQQLVYGFANTMQVVGDFDGDGRSDICIYHPDSGDWYILATHAGFSITQFGFPGTIPVPADYDGDGRTDLAVFDPPTGNWYLRRTSAGFTIIQFGYPGVTPLPCDYDGDNKSDLVVYDTASHVWYLRRSLAGFQTFEFGYGQVIPVPADYDGDGKKDVAVFDSTIASWYLGQSQKGYTNISFGSLGGFGVPADYDGDGKADLATYQLTTGRWLIRKSTGGVRTNDFGWSEAPPVGLKP